MAIHKLADGGPNPANCCLGTPRYPSRDQPDYEPWAVDWRKVHNTASFTRMLDWGCPSPGGCVACNDAADNQDLTRYLREHTLAAGDIVEIFGVPLGGIITGFCWQVWDGCAGFGFDIQLRGLAGSSVPAPVTIGTVSGAAPGQGYFHLSTPLYFDHNDMIQIKINGLCPAAGAPGCGPCGSTHLPPVMVSGFYQACCR
jgi:hypothetical protein